MQVRMLYLLTHVLCGKAHDGVRCFVNTVTTGRVTQGCKFACYMWARRHTGPEFDRMLLALLYAEVCMAALAGPHAHPGRRAALGSAAASLSLTLGSPPLAAQAAAPIEKGAPVFGTSESRTGLLDGIKSAFSEKTGAIRRSVQTSHALVTQHA